VVGTAQCAVNAGGSPASSSTCQYFLMKLLQRTACEVTSWSYSLTTSTPPRAISRVRRAAEGVTAV
jgi:hypothetical protein